MFVSKNIPFEQLPIRYGILVTWDDNIWLYLCSIADWLLLDDAIAQRQVGSVSHREDSEQIFF